VVEVCVFIMWIFLLFECYSTLLTYNQITVSLSAAEIKLTMLALQ